MHDLLRDLKQLSDPMYHTGRTSMPRKSKH